MPIYGKLLPEFDQEMATTRRVIERVPTEKGEWKPHPKSFALGHLTQLVATMPGWVARILSEDSMNLSGGAGYSFQKTESLLEQFDKLSAQAHEAFIGTSDADFEKPWSLRMGDKVLMTSTRYESVRQTINHISHHRGQLTVYLRLLDVPVPSIYGPTADEGWNQG